ncbi:hypothetical protein HAL1_11107 [Halomonas sp. HAL1]|jgi:hypothetical protein|nr:hypothetical protein HAL1_11107 [Halomonas sp. HAL1]|tara:strand:+ start:57 stop:194 length:138 start_codon:yes stop_codon:yes gene_type:complete
MTLACVSLTWRVLAAPYLAIFNSVEGFGVFRHKKDFNDMSAGSVY